MKQHGRVLLRIMTVLLFAGAGECCADIGMCYARLEDGKLSLGNSVVERVFEWNDGVLINSALTDKEGGHAFRFNTSFGKPLWSDLNGKPLHSTLTHRVIAATGLVGERFEAEVVTIYPDVKIKRVFTIYPDCPAIASQYFLQIRKGRSVSFNPRQTVLEAFGTMGDHWKYTSVEFFDRTDAINNLIRESEVVGFHKPDHMRGNILHIRSLAEGFGFYLLKEAPCSFVQLHYPGYDFICAKDFIQAAGAGVAPQDLSEGEWVPVYGVVTGLAGRSEFDFLKNLRSYQNKARPYVLERDSMIMMNTWGDRNRDASISETFAKKEIDACKAYGITHFQLDDGWQRGLSRNSAREQGQLWNQWRPEDWVPDPEKFPNGFQAVVDYAAKNNVNLGLWFNPSSDNEYRTWRQDAEVVVDLHRTYGIRYFKIDGVKLPTKQAEINFRKFLDFCMIQTNYAVFFNLDATDDNRTGYHYFTEYGNIFLENRYTDWAKYYPFWTLRNLWMLSRYVPAQRLQIEFLNKWRNRDKYGAEDPFRPFGIPWDYQFALTMMAQPLAWLEASQLPEEALKTAELIHRYAGLQRQIHAGDVFPIGQEPRGTAWTGFQSILNPHEGYVLVLREFNSEKSAWVQTWLPGNTRVRFVSLLGAGRSFEMPVREDGKVRFELDQPHSFALYRYTVKE